MDVTGEIASESLMEDTTAEGSTMVINSGICFVAVISL